MILIFISSGHRTDTGGRRKGLLFLILMCLPFSCSDTTTLVCDAHQWSSRSRDVQWNPAQPAPRRDPRTTQRLLLPGRGFPVSSIAPPAGRCPEHPSSSPLCPRTVNQLWFGKTQPTNFSANQRTAITSSLISLNLNLGEDSLSGKFVLSLTTYSPSVLELSFFSFQL